MQGKILRSELERSPPSRVRRFARFVYERTGDKDLSEWETLHLPYLIDRLVFAGYVVDPKLDAWAWRH